MTLLPIEMTLSVLPDTKTTKIKPKLHEKDHPLSWSVCAVQASPYIE